MAVTAGCPRRPSTWHRSFWWGPRWWDGPSCGRCARSLQVGAGMLLHVLRVPTLSCWALLHIPTLPWAPQRSPSLGRACRGHCRVVTGLHPGTGTAARLPEILAPQRAEWDNRWDVTAPGLPCLRQTVPAWSLPPPWHWDSVQMAPGVAGWGQREHWGLSTSKCSGFAA